MQEAGKFASFTSQNRIQLYNKQLKTSKDGCCEDFKKVLLFLPILLIDLMFSVIFWGENKTFWTGLILYVDKITITNY